MAAGSKRWIFTAEQLQNTPSRKDGVDGKKELYYRQQAASTIQDLGQKLQVYPFFSNAMHAVFISFVALSKYTRKSRCYTA